jgi:hypothetical protein
MANIHCSLAIVENGTGDRALVKGKTFWSHMELFISVAGSTLSPRISIMVNPRLRLLVFRSLSPCSWEIRCLTVNSSSIRFCQASEKERELTTRNVSLLFRSVCGSYLVCYMMQAQSTVTLTLHSGLVSIKFRVS